MNYKKLLNLELPKNLESIIEEQAQKTLLRVINGLELVVKKDICPPLMNRRKLLYQEKYVTLYHYLPVQEKVFDVPIVLVPPLMTTTDIFDLTSEHSFANALLEAGYNVYLIDFGKPDRDDSHLRIDDYILNFIYRAVHMTKKHSDAKNVTLLGYCMGGTFSILYSSISLDIKNDIKNVINIAGPLDLQLPFFDTLFKPFKKEWFALVDRFGCIPKELLTLVFQLCDPVSYIRRPLSIINKAWDRTFLAKYQSLNNFFSNFQNLPGETFKQVFEIIEANKLVAGELNLLDQKVNLANFRANLLTFAGSKDTFIPPDSVRNVQKYVSTNDFQYAEFPFGHVSIMGSEKAKDTVWTTCVDWLKTRSGSHISSNAINPVSSR